MDTDVPGCARRRFSNIRTKRHGALRDVTDACSRQFPNDCEEAKLRLPKSQTVSNVLSCVRFGPLLRRWHPLTEGRSVRSKSAVSDRLASDVEILVKLLKKHSIFIFILYLFIQSYLLRLESIQLEYLSSFMVGFVSNPSF